MVFFPLFGAATPPPCMHQRRRVCPFCNRLLQEQAKVLLKLIFLACSPQCQLHGCKPRHFAHVRQFSVFLLVSVWSKETTKKHGQDLEVKGRGRRKWFGAASGTFCVCAGGRVYFCGPEPVDKDDWPFIVLTEHTNWFLKEQVTRRQPE